MSELVISHPKMVACKRCGLLVGFSEDPVKVFFCIPCFDTVTIDGARLEIRNDQAQTQSAASPDKPTVDMTQ